MLFKELKSQVLFKELKSQVLFKEPNEEEPVLLLCPCKPNYLLKNLTVFSLEP